MLRGKDESENLQFSWVGKTSVDSANSCLPWLLLRILNDHIYDEKVKPEVRAKSDWRNGTAASLEFPINFTDSATTSAKNLR